MLSSMPSISEGEAKLPLTLFSSCAPTALFFFCVCVRMINTLSLQISYPLLPLLFILEHKQTQVDRLISFLYKSLILSSSQLCV